MICQKDGEHELPHARLFASTSQRSREQFLSLVKSNLFRIATQQQAISGSSFHGTANNVTFRGGVRSTRGLGPTMTERGQSIGISIGMLPQTLIMSITVQKTSEYYTTEFDLEEGF